MKPAPFVYHDPATLDDALDVLAEHGDEAKALAGGQSLVPLLNFRLARPELVVDLNGVAELAYLRKDGVLRIGAMTRAAALERSDSVANGWPLLREAVKLVGHPQIRSRGTVGGSVAHADPAAELPAAFAALEARFHVRSRRRSRTLGSDALFVMQLSTSLEPDELLVEIEVPPLPPRTGTAFVEHARVHGDFALAGAGVIVTLSEAGTCVRAAVALCAAAPTPVRAPRAEAALVGSPIDGEAARAASELAADAVELPASQRPYRRALVAELARRAVLAAAGRAAR
ncbi:MAG: FAD binding domain-containing protein [Actinomycetota bacterium]|nr:FAD binding domain-containing protein [Actinomycetota bacterium]